MGSQRGKLWSAEERKENSKFEIEARGRDVNRVKGGKDKRHVTLPGLYIQWWITVNSIHCMSMRCVGYCWIYVALGSVRQWSMRGFIYRTVSVCTLHLSWRWSRRQTQSGRVCHCNFNSADRKDTETVGQMCAGERLTVLFTFTWAHTLKGQRLV